MSQSTRKKVNGMKGHRGLAGLWVFLGMVVCAPAAWAADIQVQGTVSDPQATVTVKVDSGNPANAEVNGNTWTRAVNVSGSGVHTITARASRPNGTGGQDVDEKSITIELLAPLSITITSPINGAVCSSANGQCSGGTAPIGGGGGGSGS